MKVNGTGSGLPPMEGAAEQIGASQAAEGASAQGEVQGASSAAHGPTGAGPASATPQAHAQQQAGRAQEMREFVSDLGADVQAGRLSPEAAVDALVERILDRRLSEAASSPMRAQLESTLRATLAEDPFVGAQLLALSRSGR